MSFPIYLRRIVTGSVLLGSAIASVTYTSWTDIKFSASSKFGKLFQMTDPESAHEYSLWLAEKNICPKDNRPDPSILKNTIWEQSFKNPIGLAAGYDKDGKAMKCMLGMGMGFVEIGSVTPLPQEGNEKPRVFRIPEKKAVINRYGLNSEGIDVVKNNLKEFRDTYNQNQRDVIGVNLGVNRANALDWKSSSVDYVLGLRNFIDLADYIVINVSSPNTKGLISLQKMKQLDLLLTKLCHVKNEINRKKEKKMPLLVKISPDLSEQEKKDLAKIILKHKIDGLIVSNTTTSRTNLDISKEVGGLSGKPLYELSTKLLYDMYKLTNGIIPIIGCGGVSSGTEAYEKIKAGASLIQLYTALIYEGAALIPRIKSELVECLEKDGFENVSQAIGYDHKK